MGRGMAWLFCCPAFTSTLVSGGLVFRCGGGWAGSRLGVGLKWSLKVEVCSGGLPDDSAVVLIVILRNYSYNDEYEDVCRRRSKR